MKTSKEYRVQSKAALKGNWGMAIAITLVYALLTGACAATVVGAILLTGALAVGYAYAMFMIFRRGNYDLSDLFYGFKSPKFSATIGLAIKMSIYLLLWSMLFVVPGIIKTFSYSMAPYILADHPEMTGGEAITASKNLMKGKKWKLFCMEFSFIGWILLSFLTFGILFLWVGPWMAAAEADFYESIKDEVK